MEISSDPIAQPRASGAAFKNHVILLLDMDCFFASVEQRNYPKTLAGKPIVVTDPPPSSVVSAASREAKDLVAKRCDTGELPQGTKLEAGMSVADAQRICPGVVVAPPHPEEYRKVSCQIMEYIAGIVGGMDYLETKALDEAYIDATQVVGNHNNADENLKAGGELGKILKAQIFKKTGLHCTVGVGPSKNIAKIACEKGKPAWNKPASQVGVKVVLESEKVSFLRPESVTALTGVGPVKAETLANAGFQIVGHLQDFEGDLVAKVGKRIGYKLAGQLKSLALGEDVIAVKHKYRQDSFQKQDTFKACTDLNKIKKLVLKLSEQLEEALKGQGDVAFCISVKAFYKSDDDDSKSKALDSPIAMGNEIYDAAMSLLNESDLLKKPVRKIVVRVSNLTPPGTVFKNKSEKAAGDQTLSLFNLP